MTGLGGYYYCPGLHWSDIIFLTKKPRKMLLLLDDYSTETSIVDYDTNYYRQQLQLEQVEGEEEEDRKSVV